MANNPYVNKVIYGNDTVIDISDTTAEEGDVISGKSFYKASGAKATGSAVIPDISNCYQTTDAAENDIQDADYFPFYDSSASGKRKSLWSNIKSKLQAFFDGIYRKKLIANFHGGGNTATYCLLCTLVVQDPYINGPTEIVLQERGRSTVARLNIVFQSVDSQDPALISFTVIGAQNNYYVVKTAASTWQIYVTKNEPYSWIDVLDYTIYRRDTVSITWDCTNATSIPSGAIRAKIFPFDIDSNGKYIAPNTIQRNNPGGTSYIAGVGGNSGLHINKAEGDIFYPMVSTRTKTGGGWAIGNYNDDNLHFTFGTKANIQSGTNTVSQTVMRPLNGTVALTSEIPTKYAGSSSAGGDANNALKLNGYASDTAASANTIVRRQANGYIFAVYYNQSSGSETATSSSYVMFCNSDGYLRKTPMSTIKSLVDTNTNTWRGFQFVQKTSEAQTIAADSVATFNFSGLNNISGYAPRIAFYQSNNSSNKVVPSNAARLCGNGSCSFTVHNQTNTSRSVTITIIVLYTQ